MGITTFSWTANSFSALKNTAFQLDFGGLAQFGILPLITAVLSFFVVDCFDTAGTLVGCASNAGMLNEKGECPKATRPWSQTLSAL
jgi:AGZA family xanthine/uracil permease-like MFS transporter